MSYSNVQLLAGDGNFLVRLQAALVDYVVNTVFAEATNDVQTISVSGSPTGGSFTLANGPLTAAVAPAYNVTASTLQAAVQAALASGDTCVCTGGPLPGTSIAVTWTGGLTDSPQNALTVSANNLTGGSSPAASVTHTTPGVSAVNHAARAALGKLILASPQSYAAVFALSVADNATVQSDFTGGGNVSSAVTDAHILAAIGAVFNNFS